VKITKVISFVSLTSKHKILNRNSALNDVHHFNVLFKCKPKEKRYLTLLYYTMFSPKSTQHRRKYATVFFISIFKRRNPYMPRTNLKAVPARENVVRLQDFIDMISPSVIKFNTDHFICGNTFRCVWALREYPT